ncbi:DUF3888 domain-containing protein [Paenibacillus caseinilyticus]|uniref:DUF3888 domain-containing protein n=1 Tax=Paenibacillus mucilaginosus K02 TaxID=997761 RepID=I0BIV7_9BACL|nr:DUF3888 domain-containing protein [Paenibacillus mucilaginosus]AFH62304.1 hypothetical protein B2K_16510 [Paenibacillus mucilaginosus K02]
MGERIISVLISFTMLMSIHASASKVALAAESPASRAQLPEKDSKELMLQDMLVLILLPQMDKKLDEIYIDKLNYSPELYPYFVTIQHMERVNGFRGFQFRITFEVIPTVGPHIPVGKDTITFEISPLNPNMAQIVDWKHLKDPQKSDFPPNWLDVIKE